MRISDSARQVLQNLDQDGNGVSNSELQRIDTDGDGQLSAQEATAAGISTADANAINDHLRTRPDLAGARSDPGSIVIARALIDPPTSGGAMAARPVAQRYDSDGTTTDALRDVADDRGINDAERRSSQAYLLGIDAGALASTSPSNLANAFQVLDPRGRHQLREFLRSGASPEAKAQVVDAIGRLGSNPSAAERALLVDALAALNDPSLARRSVSDRADASLLEDWARRDPGSFMRSIASRVQAGATTIVPGGGQPARSTYGVDIPGWGRVSVPDANFEGTNRAFGLLRLAMDTVAADNPTTVGGGPDPVDRSNVRSTIRRQIP